MCHGVTSWNKSQWHHNLKKRQGQKELLQLGIEELAPSMRESKKKPTKMMKELKWTFRNLRGPRLKI